MLNGMFQIPEHFPGEEKIPTMIHLRTLGKDESGETFGAGFMHKAPGPDFQKKKSNNYGLVIVLKGYGHFIEQNGKVHSLKEGMVFQRFPDVEHSNYIDSQEGWFEGFLALGKQMTRALTAMGVINPDSIIVAEQLDRVRREKIVKIFYHLASQVYNLDESNILSFFAEELQALQELLQANSVRDVFDRFCERVTLDPGQRIDLEYFCRCEAVGYEWFRKNFRKRLGQSPVSYAVDRRMDQAKALLTGSNAPLYTIAEELGYTNQYEFSAQFKKKTGISPMQFRRKG